MVRVCTYRLHHFEDAIDVAVAVLAIGYIPVADVVGDLLANLGILGQADVAHQVAGGPHLLLRHLEVDSKGVREAIDPTGV